MKKLALLLGSLLVVGATASAKEAVVAPVEVSKEVVVVAEPVAEVVVVEEAFRPYGRVGLEYRAYGNTEGHDDEIVSEGESQKEWNRGANNYSRIQTTANVQATEKFNFDVRVRDYNNLDRDSNSATEKEGTETRLTGAYKHNDLLTSRFRYTDRSNNEDRYEYQLRMNVYSNKNGFVDSVMVGPKVEYRVPASKIGHTNRAGLDLAMTGNLPLGFTWENNYYFYYNKNTAKSTESFDIDVELYLYKTLALYTSDLTSVEFKFEGGYDPYSFANVNKSDVNKSYSLYAQPSVEAKYKVTNSVAVKAGLGAEYRNWNETEQSSAQTWRWQPFAYAGMDVKF
ncbi:MAG: FomA family porin-like outer membrane protein, partial [Peptostreptococcaceae bacterium]